VLVLCPKKLADNWLTDNRKLVTNALAEDRFRYDVLCHTDLQRDSGDSFGTPLNQVNWGNDHLVVIDESHNFRNDDVYKGRETRYHRLMQRVIRAGIKTKVLMRSATPVNNRFSDLKNQLALAYEGESGTLDDKLKIGRSVNQVFREAQRAFNEWSRRPPEERTPEAIGGRAPAKLRQRLAEQVQDIVWAYKLAPETINLPAGGGVAEVQVFRVLLKGAELDHDLLRAVDRAVSFPVWFELHPEATAAPTTGGMLQPMAAPKRPHATDSARQVLGEYLAGEPQPADAPRAPLPPGAEPAGAGAAGGALQALGAD
jgi:hypothetical protein